MNDMGAYRDAFLSESAEYVQSITDGLLELERNPGDSEPVEVVFRGAHSLKGMSSAMAYTRTSELTHKMEGLMDAVRSGTRAADGSLIDVMLEAVDMVRLLIADESSGQDNIDPAPIVERLTAMTEAAATSPLDSDAGTSGDPDVNGNVAPYPESLAGEGSDLFEITVRLEESCVLKAVRAYMVLKRLSHMGEVVDTTPSARELEDEEFDLEFSVLLATPNDAEAIEEAARGVSEVAAVTAARSDASVESIRPATITPDETDDAPARPRPEIPKLSETQTVRIAIGHLDTMIDLVGELVILRSRLERIADQSGDPHLTQSVEDLHRVANELQNEVMYTRMVPVSNIFNRFPRMVRDLAHDLGKDVDFVLEGLEIELDRTVLDEVGDPIVHLLRNAIDHGIESAEERQARGKSRSGEIKLSASRDRDRVRITVSDDGRGIDVERVWNEACSTGLAAEAERSAYTEEDVLLFTCAPGFSTKKVASRVSGRGVGMDVVKGKIEHLGGTLSITSRLGEGSEFTLTLPLTLAIIQALLVTSAQGAYAVPLGSVEEVLDPHEVDLDTVDGAPVLIHRDGEVVPVFRLDALLGVAADGAAPDGDGHIVMVESNDARRALVVDELLGRSEIVIKPLSRMLRSARGLGGATVLGDGSVALIIDPRTIFPADRSESR